MNTHMESMDHAGALLSRLSVQQGLPERALAAAREALRRTWQEEQDRSPGTLRGYRPTAFILRVERQEMIFLHEWRNVPFVRTHVGLYLPDPERRGQQLPAGYYLYDSAPDGSPVDEWLAPDIPRMGGPAGRAHQDEPH